RYRSNGMQFSMMKWAGFLIALAALARVSWAQDQPAAHPATVKVACIQCSSDLGDVVGNRKKLLSLVDEAAKNGGAKIIVLPEAAITGYLSQDLQTNWHVAGMPLHPNFRGKDPAGCAETIPGESTDQFCAAAKRLGVYVTVPLLEVDRGKYFNTVCLAS